MSYFRVKTRTKKRIAKITIATYEAKFICIADCTAYYRELPQLASLYNGADKMYNSRQLSVPRKWLPAHKRETLR